MNEASFDPQHEKAIVDIARRTFEAISDVSDEVAAADRYAEHRGEPPLPGAKK